MKFSHEGALELVEHQIFHPTPHHHVLQTNARLHGIHQFPKNARRSECCDGTPFLRSAFCLRPGPSRFAARVPFLPIPFSDSPRIELRSECSSIPLRVQCLL